MVISVITICYNVENEIERTLRSVLCQTFNDMEYIIVDGSSQDNTVRRAKAVIAEYSQRKVMLISEPDKGIYDAMNKGVRHASGEWLCMMNAGDCFADKFVLENVFKHNIEPYVSFLYSDLYKATSYGKAFRVEMFCNEHARHIVHQSVIYKKELHQEYGYYAVTPKVIISDYLFFLQVPIEQIRKVDTIISIYEGNGVSEQGNWCEQQILCANVVFRYGSFYSLYLDFLKWKVKRFLPKRIRERIRLWQDSRR